MMKTLYGSAVMAACLAATHAASTATEESSNPLVSTALEFLARASSTSEVLTLNLTNLIILAILKAIILGFVIFSYGAGANNAGYARSAKDVPSIKQSDLTGGMCFMMFTAGDEAKLSCVQRSACEDPKTATDYLTAAKMWHKMHKLMKVIPFSSEYVDIMTAVQEATEHSLKGGDCSAYRW